MDKVIKLQGNGQCSCKGCKNKKGFNRHWTSMCYEVNDEVYCSSCLKELFKVFKCSKCKKMFILDYPQVPWREYGEILCEDCFNWTINDDIWVL